MSGSLLDSKAVFLARLRTAGIPEADIALLIAANVDTMAKMAWVCSVQPGVGDDAPLMAFFVQVLGRSLDTFSAGEISVFRRLWWECHTVAIAEVRSKVERTEDSQPKKLPVPERAERLREQQARLVGIVISGVIEPSHCLLDFCNQMKEDEVLRYVNPNICSTRAAELLGVKKENFMTPNSQGALVSVSKETPTAADLQGEYRVRLALQRRSLALDQVKLIRYEFGEAYHNYLFALMAKVVPTTHKKIGLAQILAADEQVWAAMTEHCREGISIRPDGSYPMEVAMTTVRSDPIVLSYLSPLPNSGGGSSSSGGANPKSKAKSAPYEKGRGKGKDAGKKGGKGVAKGGKAGKDRTPLRLRGLHVKTASGKSLCFSYNLDGCQEEVHEGECWRGSHQCAKCLGNHPLAECRAP